MNDLNLNLADAVTLGNEVLHAFVAAPHLFTDPMFLARYALIAVEVATAPDDETRRGFIQAGVIQLQKEFAQ
ncbi:hypothetical protein GCM10022631_30040 [Deinococcus rubellus]|uniref:hypothetical protein n=1 Tax=Deinococcus rubellus TaxID=1889240 RepID=UPI0031E4EAC8